MLKAPAKRTSRAKATMRTPVRIVSAAAATTNLTIVFDQPVVLKGTPGYSVDVASTNPVSAAMTSPTTLVVTFNASIAAANTVTIPFEEPNVRNAVGGYVADMSFPV